MKKILPFLLVLFSCFSNAQAPFWNESFGTGCSMGQVANGFNASGLGAWSVSSTGTNGFLANNWFISATEAGVGIGNCGDGCSSNPLLTNRTLHISLDWNSISPGFADFGSTYSAGSGSETDLRVQSPVINCTGQSNINLSFSYILEGVPSSDYFEVQYSANGGTNWTTISTPPPTNNAVCSGQGFWTTYSITLPATANNNNNVKIGFRWQNVDATGADPSVALDDVKLTSGAPASFAPTFTVVSPLCVGNSATVTANTGTFAVTGYTWSVSPAATIASSNASSTAITFTTNNTHTITLTATSGATTTSSTNTVIVNANPNINASPSSSGLCSGQSLTLSATGATNYTWNPGTLTGSVVTITPGISGTHTVTGTSGACTNTATVAYNVVPTPTINVSVSPTLICSGSSATLTAAGAANYSWTPGPLSGSSTVVSPTNTITYTCVGTNSNCSNSNTVTLNVSPCTGLNSLSENTLEYSIFPNPADNVIYIACNENNVFVEVFDAVGKKVSLNSSYNNVNHTHQLNISNLQCGLYFVKISKGSITKTSKFVKE